MKNGGQVSIYLSTSLCIAPEQTADKLERRKKLLWAKRQSGTETGFYLPWHPVLHFSPGQGTDKQERKETAMGQKAIWNGDKFLQYLPWHLAML